MSLTAIFQWDNSDSTADLNQRFSSIYAKGIISNTGGLLSPVSGQLQVTLSPYIAVGFDGMMVQESAAQTFNLVINQTNVIALRAVHNIGAAPTLTYGVFEITAFNNLVNRDQYIAFGAVTVSSPATQATTNDISYSGRDQNDQIQRNPFRGRVSSQTITCTEVEGSPVLATTQLSDLSVGLAVSGIGIASASYITAINSPVSTTASFTTSSTAITVNSVTGIYPGMLVTDTTNSNYIPAGTTVTSIVSTTVFISQATIGTAANDTVSFQGSFVINNNAISPGGSQSLTFVNLPVLTPNQNLPGDFYMVNQGTGDLASIWAWNGEVWINITDSQSIESELTQHEENFFQNQIHLTSTPGVSDQASAALGSYGIPGLLNRYVTQTDPQFPSTDEAEALVGFPTSPAPSASNAYITQQYPVAATTQVLFALPPGGPIQIQASEGPIYVGTGPVNSANVFFMLMDFSLKRGYVNNEGVAPQIVGVFTDGLLTQPLVPSSNANVDANGFFTGDLFLQTSTVVDTGFRLVYGCRQILSSVVKDFTVNTTPGDDTIPSLVVQQVANIKGRSFDTSTPTDEQNINLRIDLNGVHSYLGSVLDTNTVADAADFKRLADEPTIGSYFDYNVGIEPIYTYLNSSLTGYTYALVSGTGTITYTSGVIPVGVQAGNLFIDGDNNQYVIQSVISTTQLTIVLPSTGLAPSASTVITAPSGAGTAQSGACQVNNNPRNVLISEMKIDGLSEVIAVPSIQANNAEFSQPLGQVAYAPVRPDQRLEPRLVFYGDAWENFQDPVTGEQYVRNAGTGSFMITSIFTDVAVIVRRRAGSPPLSVSINGTTPFNVSISGGGLIADAVTTAFGPKYEAVPIAKNLQSRADWSATTPSTITATIAAASSESFDIYGILLMKTNDTTAGTVVLESGVAFAQAQIIQNDVVNSTVPIPPLTPYQRGGRVSYAANNGSFNTAISQLATLDGAPNTSASPNGTLTNSGSTSQLVLSNSNYASLLVGYQVNDIVQLINTTSLLSDIHRITAINNNTVTFESTSNTNGSTCNMRHICSTNSPVVNPIDAEVARYNLVTDFTNGTPTDFSGPATANRYALGKDKYTLVAGTNLSVQFEPVVTGSSAAVRIESGGTLRIKVLATRLDILVNSPSAVSFNVSIDGSPAYTWGPTIGGGQLVNLFYNARYQDHEVVITNATGLAISEIIIFAPAAASLPVDTVAVADLYQPAFYLPSLSYLSSAPNTYLVGGWFHEALHYIATLLGTGVNPDWTLTQSWSDAGGKSPYGQYMSTANNGSAAEFWVLGTGFELQYIMGPNHGYFNVSVDGTDLASVSGTLVGSNPTGGAYSGGVVDAYSAGYTRRNIGVYGLAFGLHHVVAKIPSTLAKNSASTGYYMAFTGYYAINMSSGTTATLSIGIDQYGNYNGVVDTRTFAPLPVIAGVTPQTYELLGSNVTALTSNPNYAGRGAPLRTVGNSQGFADAIASMDNQISLFFDQLRMLPSPQAGGTIYSNRVAMLGSDVTMLDGTTRSQIIKTFLMNFSGAQFSFGTSDAGTIYDQTGLTSIGSFAAVNPGPGNFLWYSITAQSNTLGSDNRMSIEFTVTAATSTGTTQATAPRATFVSGFPIGEVCVAGTTGSATVNVLPITAGQIVQLGIGAGAGSSGSGGGAPTQPADGFSLVVSDTFQESPSAVGSFVNPTYTTGSYNPASNIYSLLCDKTPTITTLGVDFTLSQAPSGFSLAVGNVIWVNSLGTFSKVATVTSTTTGTLDVAFSADQTAAAGMVAQALWTLDLANVGDPAHQTRPCDFYPNFNSPQINIDYEDSLASGDAVADLVAQARVVVAASNYGFYNDTSSIALSSQYAPIFTRPSAPNQINNYVLDTITGIVSATTSNTITLSPINTNFLAAAGELTYSTSLTTTGTFSSGSLTITVASAAGIVVGMYISDTSNTSYIQPNTIVTSIVGTTIGINQPTMGAASGDGLSIQGNTPFTYTSYDSTSGVFSGVSPSPVGTVVNGYSIIQAQQRCFLVFFPNPNNSTVTSLANIITYDCSVYPTQVLSNGGYLNASYCQSDGSGTPINCSNPTVVGGLSQLVLGFTYVPGLNQLPLSPDGDLEVIVEGEVIPRYFPGVVGAYYTEINFNTIGFWSNLSGSSLSIHVRQRQGSIDSNSNNALKLTALVDIVVGSTAQVAAGIASYSSLQAAVSVASPGQKIVFLAGATVTESVTISVPVIITGHGTSSIINGNLTLAAGSDGTSIELMYISGSITLNSNYNFLWKNWQLTGQSFTDAGTENHYLIIPD